MATRQPKQQVTDNIMKDNDLLKLIAEAVSLLIVEKLSSDKDTIIKVAETIAKQPEFENALKTNLSDQTSVIKQEVYESLVFDNVIKEHNVELKQTCRNLQDNIDNLVLEIDALEQYGRQNCLLIHGIPETRSDRGNSVENTEALVLGVMNNKLGLGMDSSSLDRCHRLGLGGGNHEARGGQTHQKSRPIIVKFVAYSVRSEVFRCKRKLKGTGLAITESLTRRRMETYKAVFKHRNVQSLWTIDGRIVALRTDNQ
jgi:hypothetical protein